MLNQYHLVIILPILVTHFKNEIKFYYSDAEVDISLGFMDYVEIPYLDALLNKFDYQQSHKSFSDNGYKYGSSLKNQSE